MTDNASDAENTPQTEDGPAVESTEQTVRTDAAPAEADAPDAAADQAAPAEETAPGEEESAGGESDGESRLHELEEEGDIAADYLEELLDIADLDGDIDIDVDGDRASVEIRGAQQLARLNRPKGELMDALQELTRLAVQARTGNRSRLMLDISGFRAEQRTSLEELAADAIVEAKEKGEAMPLRPMNPYERKIVHDVAKREGLRSESDGDGKNRHVVIYPAS